MKTKKKKTKPNEQATLLVKTMQSHCYKELHLVDHYVKIIEQLHKAKQLVAVFFKFNVSLLDTLSKLVESEIGIAESEISVVISNQSPQARYAEVVKWNREQTKILLCLEPRKVGIKLRFEEQPVVIIYHQFPLI